MGVAEMEVAVMAEVARVEAAKEAGVMAVEAKVEVRWAVGATEGAWRVVGPAAVKAEVETEVAARARAAAAKAVVMGAETAGAV